MIFSMLFLNFTSKNPNLAKNLTKGWEATFLIRAFGLSEEESTEVGFAFSKGKVQKKC